MTDETGDDDELATLAGEERLRDLGLEADRLERASAEAATPSMEAVTRRVDLMAARMAFWEERDRMEHWDRDLRRHLEDWGTHSD